MKNLDAKWVIIGVVLLSALVTSALINADHATNLGASITNTINPDNGDTKINWNRYPATDVELSDTLTITTSGTYHLTGILSDGSIKIATSNSDVVRLILDNVAIQNSTGPAIYCAEADDLVIELVGDNFLTDGASYANDYDIDVTSAIYSKADLTFQGDGSLNLVANYQDGIVGKDDVKFSSGTYNITAKDDAIRGKDSVYIIDGTYNLTATADAIKSTNETDADKGFILIENGNFNIAAGDDGIHAIQKLAISGGIINIAKSYEGLEAKIITIDNGSIRIIASDDGINAGGGSDDSATNQPNKNPFAADESCILAINGGNIYINAAGDGIDSNGYLYFNGGTTIVDGPVDNGNGALDSGASITINGGTVIAVGSSGMVVTPSNASIIYSASIYLSSTQSAGTTVTIKDSADNTIIAHTSTKSFSHITIGTAAFTLGQTYTIYINGEKYQDFTITDTVTIVGNRSPQQIPRR